MRGFVAISVLLVGVGCTISSDYRAFVEASRGFYESAQPAIVASVLATTPPPGVSTRLHMDWQIEKLDEARDYERALIANEVRVGLRAGR